MLDSVFNRSIMLVAKEMNDTYNALEIAHIIENGGKTSFLSFPVSL